MGSPSPDHGAESHHGVVATGLGGHPSCLGNLIGSRHPGDVDGVAASTLELGQASLEQARRDQMVEARHDDRDAKSRRIEI